ncbi:hypothetical protein [Methyloversatilis thermotolerans]|uniref:hypothetical protein n=1 Tax=Methyloversatilis thermotolerans TaxID=1346290 RepID=UPI00037747C1|nr:hypothetical protein [Methyloversatilis thermotolerans]
MLPLLLAACASAPRPPATGDGAADAMPAREAAADVARSDDAARERDAERRLQQAMQWAQPRGGQLARARSQLEAFLALDDEAARTLHPYARALLDQVMERQRLDAANSRLTQQLERSAQQLKDSQARAEELQRKLDALADIERSLPGSRPAVRGVPR